MCCLELRLRLFRGLGLWRAGKVHGSLSRAGKVRAQTPKVEVQEKPKKPKGRAGQRLKFNRRFVNVVATFGGRKRGPNSKPAE